MKDYTNKTVFVVGGSSGIGLAAAELFAQRGANVAIFARHKPLLAAAVKRVAGRATGKTQKIASYSMDVAERAAVDSTMKTALKEFGTPDVLFNAAGRAIPMRFEEMPPKQFDETMNINFTGTVNTVRALLPAMKKKGNGAIVNTSSIAGYIGVFGYTDYNASKFAVLGFSEALRAELLGCHIQVTVLCPPDTDTPGLAIEKKTKPPETQAITKGAGLLSAETVAGAMIEGMEKGRFVVVPGFDGKFSVFMQRHMPWLVTWVMDGTIRKVQKGKK